MQSRIRSYGARRESAFWDVRAQVIASTCMREFILLGEGALVCSQEKAEGRTALFDSFDGREGLGHAYSSFDMQDLTLKI